MCELSELSELCPQDAVGPSLRKGRSWVGWVQISPLFHEDDQDDQILIDHLAWVVAKARMRAHSTETASQGMVCQNLNAL